MTAHPRITAVEPIYARPDDAPKLFGFSKETLYRMAREGEIKLFKRGQITLVRVADVKELIEGWSE